MDDDYIFTEDIIDELFAGIAKYKEDIETKHMRERISLKINKKKDIGPLNLDCDALSSSEEEEICTEEDIFQSSEKTIEEDEMNVQRKHSILDFFDEQAEGSGEMEQEEDEDGSTLSDSIIDDDSQVNEEIDYSVYKKDFHAEQQKIKEEIRDYREQYKRRKKEEVAAEESSEDSAYSESCTIKIYDGDFEEENTSITLPE